MLCYTSQHNLKELPLPLQLPCLKELICLSCHGAGVAGEFLRLQAGPGQQSVQEHRWEMGRPFQQAKMGHYQVRREVSHGFARKKIQGGEVC